MLICREIEIIHFENPKKAKKLPGLHRFDQLEQYLKSKRLSFQVLLPRSKNEVQRLLHQHLFLKLILEQKIF